MPEFTIAIEYSNCGEVTVEADTFEEAVKKVEERFLDKDLFPPWGNGSQWYGGAIGCFGFSERGTLPPGAHGPGPKPAVNRPRSPAGLLEVADELGSLQERVDRLERQIERDSLLGDADKNRQLVAALYANDWLGLATLLEAEGRTAGEIAARHEADIDLTCATLCQLAAFGAVRVEDRRFFQTELGQQLAQKYEALDP